MKGIVQVSAVCIFFILLCLLPWGCNSGDDDEDSPTPVPTATHTPTPDPGEPTPTPTQQSGNSVIVSTVDELFTALEDARNGLYSEILIEDGLYSLHTMLWIDVPYLTIRGQSGNRENVILEGQGMMGEVTHVFNVAADGFRALDMTLRLVSQHAVQLQLDIDNVVLKNLHLVDIGEQMIKIAYDESDPQSSENGIVENCLLEYTADYGPQYYIGGIDGHYAFNWTIRNNVFMNIRSPEEDTAEHAIHFWSDSQNTLVEKNIIINCDRGIGFGLGDRGHQSGIIRNNIIYHDGIDDNADVGIGLENAADVAVYNNTIFMENSYPNALEYRFSNTNAYIANNLTNRNIQSRDGGSATLETNYTEADSSFFENVLLYDFHLSGDISMVVDSGTTIDELTDDFEGDSRPQGAGFDIGADELVP